MLGDVPLLFAFSAGLLATVNPCGFAMLPAYLSYFLGTDAPTRTPAAVANALKVGATVSLGFLVVFGIAGGLLAVGIDQVITAVPFLALGVGVLIIALGVWMLTGREFVLKIPGLSRFSDNADGSAFSFGISYAVASLSCTLPIFLTVVAAATAAATLPARLAVAGAYAGGMALLLVAITVLLAVGRASLVRRLRSIGPKITRIAGGILVLAGVWVVGFWALTLTSGPLSASVAVPEQIAARIANAVAANPLAWGGALALVVVAAVWFVWRWGAGDDGDDDGEPGSEPALLGVEAGDDAGDDSGA